MAQIVNSRLEVLQHRIPAGKRYIGQHAEADGITPSPGDEFYAWDTGWVMREKDADWYWWYRTLPISRELAATTTFTTESF